MQHFFESEMACPICGNTYVSYNTMLYLAYTDYLDEKSIERLDNSHIIVCEGYDPTKSSTKVLVGCGARTPSFTTMEEAREYWEDTVPIKNRKSNTTIGEFNVRDIELS